MNMNRFKYISQYILILFLWISYSASFAQNQWEWAIGIGGNVQDKAEDIDTDSLGNVYTIGYYKSSNISIDTITITKIVDEELFLVKQNRWGNVIWAKRFAVANCGCGSTDNPEMIVDAAGNIFITGKYRLAILHLDTITLTNSLVNSFEMFVAKFNTDGDIQWARTAGGNTSDYGTGITLDKFGNVIVSGIFMSPTFNIDTITLTAKGNGFYNAVLLKFDPNGNLLWARNEGGYGGDVIFYSVASHNGDIYAAGNFWSASFSIDTTIVTSNGGMDILLVKYDSGGNTEWVYNKGGSNTDFMASVTTDISGDVYITGDFYSDTIMFDTIIMTNPGYSTGLRMSFLVKVDNNGNTIWTKKMSSSGLTTIYSIETDNQNNILITGNYTSPFISFGNDTLIYNTGSPNLFLAKFNSSGFLSWSLAAGGAYEDYAKSIAVSADGSIYIAGAFGSPNINFDSLSLTNHGVIDAFIAKLGTYSANAGENFSICGGDSVVIGGNPTALNATAPLTYLWIPSIGLNDSSIANPLAVPTTTTTYTVFVTDSNNLIVSDSVTVYVNIPKYVYLGNDTIICTRHLMFLDAGPGFVSYLWSDSSIQQILLVDSSGLGGLGEGTKTVFVTVIDSNGCQNSDTIYITFVTCSGINNLDIEPHIYLYPNPTNSIINLSVEGLFGETKIAVYNTLGNIIYSENFILKSNISKKSIDFSSQPKGVYYIRLINKNYTITEKIVRD